MVTLVSDFDEGDVFMFGGKKHEVTNIHNGSRETNAYIETKCDDAECLVREAGNRHRVYEKAFIKWLDDGYARLIE